MASTADAWHRAVKTIYVHLSSSTEYFVQYRMYTGRWSLRMFALCVLYYNDGMTVDKITAEADRTNRLFAATASYAGMQC